MWFFLLNSGIQLLLVMALLCLLFWAFIYFGKRWLGAAQKAGSPQRLASERTGVFSLRPTIHKLALCVALGLALLAINWTARSAPVSPDFYVEAYEDDFTEEVPITFHEPPPPPPPPPPPVFDVSDEPFDEPIVFEDNEIEAETSILEKPTAAPPLLSPTPPPPPPAAAVMEEDLPMIFAERMPVFGASCQELPTEAERKACSDQALLQFLSRELKYPALAREVGLQGQVVVQFTVEKDGRIADMKLARGLGGGLSEEALRVVGLIDQKTSGFSPGRQQGRTVRVRYTVPIKFRLE